jgi:hypothetical protein
MNFQQLEILGKAVAQQVTAQTGVQEVRLSTVVSVDDECFGLSGTMTHEGREKSYALKAHQVQQLLVDTEAEASEFLRKYLHYQARWFLFNRQLPHRDDHSEG